MMMPVTLPPFLAEMLIKSKEAQKQLPDVLAKQKAKFLIAINKKAMENNVTKEDDQFVQKVMRDLYQTTFSKYNNYDSHHWEDSEATKIVNDTINRNAIFELSRYLDCAKIVCLAYCGINKSNHITDAAEYVLTHARLFGDPSKTIFQIDNNITSCALGQVILPSASLPASKFMNKIENLISDLRSSYDESKFRRLNANVTYITLLMLRRVVKKESEFLAAMKRIQTHDSYVQLCPWPLNNELPKSDISQLTVELLKHSACLAIYAYLNVDDETTKQVLQATCVQYMKWNGLHLPYLFFKVVEIYSIEEGKLWDLLSLNCCAESLIALANVYYDKYEALKDDPAKTQNWFPYCRVLNGYYHKNMSASKNYSICVILAYLVDLKIGFDISTVRHSHWAKHNTQLKLNYEFAVKYATAVYEKLK